MIKKEITRKTSMKKHLFISIMLVLGLSGFAEQYTRIGVVDMTKISSNSYVESQDYRRLLELRDQYQAEIAAKNQNITQLENRKRQFEIDGNETEALRVENQIYAEQRRLRDLVEIRQQRLLDLKKAAMEDSSWLENVLITIRRVAQSEGFSIVLRMDDENLLYFSDTVDITDLVIEQLNR
jgi:outer membrane protein